MDQRITEILAQGWNGVEIVVTPLIGGIPNQNYRLDIGTEALVLRIGGKGTHLLGIDRERECACTTLAAHSWSRCRGCTLFPLRRCSCDTLYHRYNHLAGNGCTTSDVQTDRHCHASLPCRIILPRHILALRDGAYLP